MTASYPVGDACADVVAHGATLRARTASWEKPGNVAGADSAVGSSGN
jgi:hypothetical protein